MKRQRAAGAGFCVFRRPLLALDDLVALTHAGQPGTANEADTSEAAWSRLLSNAGFANALQLQSPSLWAAIGRTRASREALSTSAVADALYRYAGRASWRGAPRGLFSSAGVGPVADEQAHVGSRNDQPRVRIDLSLDYVSAVIEQLTAQRAAWRDMRFVRNPTLATFGTTVYFRGFRSTGGPHPGAIRLEASALLRRLLDSLDSAPADLRAVRQWLLASDVPQRHLDDRLHELLEAEILVPSLAVCPASDDPVGDSLRSLPSRGVFRAVKGLLEEVRERLRLHRWMTSELSVQSLEEQLQALPKVSGFDTANRVFAVETLSVTGAARLSTRRLDSVKRAAEFLHAAFGDMGVGRLEGVKQAFHDRFGAATVPLLHVLNGDHGIGHEIGRSEAPARWGMRGRRAATLRALHASLLCGGSAIELDESFLCSLEDIELPSMPPACTALCRILSAGTERPEQHGDIRLLSVAGCNGSELWARHVHTDPAFVQAATELRALLPGPSGVVQADVVISPPSGRNLAARPGWERARILCSPVPPRPGRVDLALHDLHLQLVNERLCLVSRTLGCEIQPVIGSSIDPGQVSSPAYRLLCLLAAQDWATPLRWTWGELEESPFLPTVRLGDVILSEARWRIVASDLPAGGAPGDASGRSDWIDWCAVRRLPRWAVVRDGDDSLPADLWQPCGESMVRKAVEQHGAAFVEALPLAQPPAPGAAVGPTGHVTELLVPLLYEQSRPSGQHDRSIRLRPADWMSKFSEGARLPGSDWVYAKLYASAAAVDGMLTRELPELLVRLRADCGVRCWFFFRYLDTSWHLRLRVQVAEPAVRARAQALIEEAAAALHSQGLVWRLQFDTYFREIERFGGARACDLVEQYFEAESELALDALAEWPDASTYLDASMQLAASWVAWTWGQLGLDVPASLALCRALSAGHDRASAGAPSLQAGVGMGRPPHEATRSRARVLRGMAFEEVSAVGGRWRAHCKRACASLSKLRAMSQSAELSGGTETLAGNLAHLMVARLYAEDHDAHERILYVQLSRRLRNSRQRPACTPAQRLDAEAWAVPAVSDI